jgi:Cu2+-exporting ATPase
MQVVPQDAIASPAAPDTDASDNSTATLTLDVSGMKCAGCVKAVENRLIQQAGVLSATVNLVTEMALVEYQPDEISGAALAQQLTAAGFPSTLRWSSHEAIDEQPQGLSPAEKQQKETHKRLRQVAIATVLLILSTIGHLQHVGWTVPILSDLWFHATLATLTLLFPGRPILLDGWRGLRHNTPNMNTLVGLGALTAYLTSVVALLVPRLGWECFFDEPVMLFGFILLGRALEQQARSRAVSSFQALLAMQPAFSKIILNDRDLTTLQEQAASLPPEADPAVSLLPSALQVPTDRVKVGEWLLILPGDRIPVDGEVVAGQTTIDEAMLTGEALPVFKQIGDGVVAGSLNQSGTIALKATRTGRESTLAQMIELIEAAQTRKPPVQKLADVIAGYFTYGVIAIAALTFVFWYFIGTHLWTDMLQDVLQSDMVGHGLSTLGHSAATHTKQALHHSQPALRLLMSLKLAIAVLVVACPCALGLATPTAILVGTSMGAEQGLLIRGGDVLEKIYRLTTVVFDKTGTLTVGQPQVTDCIPLTETLNSTNLLQIAASVERGTRHPLAAAIQTAAQQQNLPLLAAEQFFTQPGFGVSAVLQGQSILIGNLDWMQQHEVWVASSTATQVKQLEEEGKTTVYVAIDRQLVGLIAAVDTLRPEALITVQHLQQMGLQVILLTGDRPTAAMKIAQTLGIAPANVLAGVRPAGKVEAIAQLQTEGHRVAMVGDGINDAPALTQADIGISLHSGADVAIETAEIILMRNSLEDIVKAIRLGQATFQKINQNLFWAFIYNIAGIPIAAGALLPFFGLLLSPATAGALMAFSSVSVVTSSLLLRRSR